MANKDDNGTLKTDKSGQDQDNDYNTATLQSGKSWVTLATEGEMAPQTWNYAWRTMRDRFYPHYVFYPQDPRFWDDDDAYMDNTLPVGYGISYNSLNRIPMNRERKPDTESSSSRIRPHSAYRKSCTYVLILMGILFLLTAIIPVLLHIFLGKDADKDKPEAVVHATLELENLKYSPELSNISQSTFKDMEQTLKREIDELFSKSDIKRYFKSSTIAKAMNSSANTKIYIDLHFNPLDHKVPLYRQLISILRSVQRDINDSTLGVLGKYRFNIDSIDMFDTVLIYGQHKTTTKTVEATTDFPTDTTTNQLIQISKSTSRSQGVSKQTNVNMFPRQKDGRILKAIQQPMEKTSSRHIQIISKQATSDSLATMIPELISRTPSYKSVDTETDATERLQNNTEASSIEKHPSLKDTNSSHLNQSKEDSKTELLNNNFVEVEGELEGYIERLTTLKPIPYTKEKVSYTNKDSPSKGEKTTEPSLKKTTEHSYTDTEFMTTDLVESRTLILSYKTTPSSQNSSITTAVSKLIEFPRSVELLGFSNVLVPYKNGRTTSSITDTSDRQQSEKYHKDTTTNKLASTAIANNNISSSKKEYSTTDDYLFELTTEKPSNAVMTEFEPEFNLRATSNDIQRETITQTPFLTSTKSFINTLLISEDKINSSDNENNLPNNVVSVFSKGQTPSLTVNSSSAKETESPVTTSITRTGIKLDTKEQLTDQEKTLNADNFMGTITYDFKNTNITTKYNYKVTLTPTLANKFDARFIQPKHPITINTNDVDDYPMELPNKNRMEYSKDSTTLEKIVSIPAKGKMAQQSMQNLHTLAKNIKTTPFIIPTKGDTTTLVSSSARFEAFVSSPSKRYGYTRTSDMNESALTISDMATHESRDQVSVGKLEDRTRKATNNAMSNAIIKSDITEQLRSGNVTESFKNDIDIELAPILRQTTSHSTDTVSIHSLQNTPHSLSSENTDTLSANEKQSTLSYYDAAIFTGFMTPNTISTRGQKRLNAKPPYLTGVWQAEPITFPETLPSTFTPDYDTATFENIPSTPSTSYYNLGNSSTAKPGSPKHLKQVISTMPNYTSYPVYSKNYEESLNRSTPLNSFYNTYELATPANKPPIMLITVPESDILPSVQSVPLTILSPSTDANGADTALNPKFKNAYSTISTVNTKRFHNLPPFGQTTSAIPPSTSNYVLPLTTTLSTLSNTVTIMASLNTESLSKVTSLSSHVPVIASVDKTSASTENTTNTYISSTSETTTPSSFLSSSTTQPALTTTQYRPHIRYLWNVGLDLTGLKQPDNKWKTGRQPPNKLPTDIDKDLKDLSDRNKIPQAKETLVQSNNNEPVAFSHSRDLEIMFPATKEKQLGTTRSPIRKLSFVTVTKSERDSHSKIEHNKFAESENTDVKSSRVLKTTTPPHITHNISFQRPVPTTTPVFKDVLMSNTRSSIRSNQNTFAITNILGRSPSKQISDIDRSILNWLHPVVPKRRREK